MKSWKQFGAAVVAPALLWGGAALAQSTPPATGQSHTPEKVEGEVVKIDRNSNRVTIRGSDGQMHEFQASKETLQGLKEGDRIEARLRK
jgi:Cu/Ag efflux protein CusF